MNNFGDLLGPMIVDRMKERLGLAGAPARRDARLLAVGSILRMADDGDVIWGVGVNGKSLDEPYRFTDLDVRAVRGPLTRDFLVAKGIEVPAIFGDPGLLVGRLWSREDCAAGHQVRPVSIVPNFHDYPAARRRYKDLVIDPRAPIWDVIGRIAASEFVVGSSLHGVVVAESMGIAARLLRSEAEPEFKYRDYYLGTGRSSFQPAADLTDAVAQGGERPPDWDPQPLLAAFPADLWS